VRALVVPVTASVAVHLVLVFVAARAPAPAASKRATVPLKVREAKHQAKLPELPPPPVRRIARSTPKRVPAASAPEPPATAKPPPPQGFSVDTKSTVESSSVAVTAKEGGGNLFGDPNRNLPPADKVTARPPPPPESLEPAQWMTDEADRSPPYPGAALRNEIEGQVLLRVCVGASGAVESVQLLKGLGFGCDEAATTWAKQRWHFRPARRGGKPVTTCLMQPMRFQLQR
jgi:protein TonB